MKKLCFAVVALFCVSAVIAVAAEKEKNHLSARLNGLQEVATPTAITNGTGTFTATLNDDSTLTYTLTYANLSSKVLQSHIHSPPPGTPACPDDATHSGTVSRTVSAADVIGPAAQGVGAGDFADVVRAIASHVTYANVHTSNFPAGEIRGQIRQHGDDDDDELPGAR
jgi:CHRD domain